MQWIAPSEKDAINGALETRLWAAADQLRANSGLTSQQYSLPVLGLIFLRFAEVRFAKRRAELEKPAASSRRASRQEDPTAYHAEGVLYLPEKARFATLLNLPEGADVGKAVNGAMADIEKHNPQLAGVLPRTYQVFTSTLLKELLKKVSEIPASLDYDAFGRVYEYFLGEFAMTEGQQGGEFYTPSSIVRLLVENRRSHAQVMRPAPNTIASTGFPVLTPTKIPFTFLYFATTTDDFVPYLTNHATGAPYPAVTAATLEKADLLIPPAALLKALGEATIPMAEQVHTLRGQIQNLRRTRDLLLSRLLSGKVEFETEAA